MTPLQHLELLSRYDRTFKLRDSIISAVEPSSRVLDAGCGVALLSFMAIDAGASEVVAIDVETVPLAEAVANENGYTDSIRFVSEDLWTVELPKEKNTFDTIVAMVYVNDPRRDETQSQLAYSLRDRYLAPGGCMVPDRVRYLVRACDWPSQDHRTRLSDLRDQVADLEKRYGFNFGALAQALSAEPARDFFPHRNVNGRLVRPDARALSEPVLYADIDYNGPHTSYPDSFNIRTHAPGTFNGLIWTQELWFRDQLIFSNESLSWIAEPRSVTPTSSCTVRTGEAWRHSNVASITSIVEEST